MKKDRMKSRKLWAWIIWSVLIVCAMIFKFDVSEAWINGYMIVTVLYLGGQSAVDVVERLKLKPEKEE